MTGNSSVLLTYVFPTVGCLISLLTFSSSFVAVLQVRRTKRLGVSIVSAYSGDFASIVVERRSSQHGLETWLFIYTCCDRN